MTILDLKNQIVKNQMSNFYIFVGEEIGIINIYLKQMSNKLNLPLMRASSVASIYGAFSSGSLFGDSTNMYVVRGDSDFMKAESAYETIKENVGKNVLVLLYDKIDSRLKFGKHFKDDIVAFEKLTPAILKSYIKKEIQLSDKNVETLMDLCSYSYDMCLLEIDKIKQFTEGYATDKEMSMPYDNAFLRLLGSGAIYQPQETDVFKFVDTFCSGDIKNAINLERTLRNSGTSSINILGTLYSTLKNIMLIQLCESGNVSEVTGLDNRQIYFSKKYVNKISINKLVSAVKLIPKVISGVKSGWIEDAYATRYVFSLII